MNTQPKKGIRRLMAGNIHVRGAREHNLKNVDVIIPRDSLTVLTGQAKREENVVRSALSAFSA